mmetsp:Transcript_84955/g.160100  ORF Transcript_84955/g.160100 Transcript_84955/m.160100 type:complete len:579 (+) Transcript_84955:62-1798(+)
MRRWRLPDFIAALLQLAFFQPALGNRFDHVNDVNSHSLAFIQSKSHHHHRRLRFRSRLHSLNAEGDDLALIPKPLEVEVDGQQQPLKLKRSDVVVVEASSSKDADALVEHVLKKAQVSAGHGSGLPVFKLQLKAASEGDAGKEDEAYILKVSGHQKTVLIEATTSHGLFNGMMTLRQLLKQDGASTVNIPSVKIRDAPAKEWRGLMLDVSRHFFTAKDVKKLLHTMALFKLNRFHWHLTDDQGWRVPIEHYPNLTDFGAWRKGTQMGHVPYLHDDVRYGGHYTKEEMLDVVQYANSLHIEVVPETDLPGHSEAAIASYPRLGNPEAIQVKKPEVETQFGAMKWTMGPSDYSKTFIHDIVSEVSNLVKSPYYHVGGDEVPNDQWVGSQEAKNFVDTKLPGWSVGSLEAYFTEQALENVNRLGRRGIVWDEALSTGRKLPQGTIAMLWRSWENMHTLSRRARAQGVSVIMCPQDRSYLDAWQDNTHDRYDAIGGFTPLEKTYSLSLEGFGADVLGGQAQLWSEYIREGLPNLEYMAWPRGIALAEVTWSDTNRPVFEQFLEKLEVRKRDLDEFGVNYHPF